MSCLICMLSASLANAYPGDVHQQLTYIAARQYNHCVIDQPALTLTALDVRYAAQAARDEAEPNLWRRVTQWPYYDREQRRDRRWLGIIQTRFQQRFTHYADVLHRQNDGQYRFNDLGRLLTYLQDVSVPAIVVPVYFQRFWRLSTSDRFADYPLGIDQHHVELDELCPELLALPNDADYVTVLHAAAARTLADVQAEISGHGVTWQVFWQLNPGGGFGRYGPAGNAFGEEVTFPCREGDCHLQASDGAYGDFAGARHQQAVLHTMQAFLITKRAASTRESAGMPAGDAIRNPGGADNVRQRVGSGSSQ